MKVSARASALLRRVGLLVSGLVVLGLAGGVVGAAATFEPPTPSVVEVPELRVGAGATSWVCAPAPTLPTAAAGEDLEYDPDLGTGGGSLATLADLTAVGDAGRPVMSAGAIGQDRVDVGGAGQVATVSEPDVTDPVVAVVEPDAEGVPLVAALGLARADSGDLRGLVASVCQQPVASALLVGGSTALGSSARLILSNPGDTAATVRVTAWGATGVLPDPPTVVVPAGAVRAVLLETISLEPRVAVRIDAEGGRVVPVIQDSALDGLVAAGTDMVGQTADPTTELLVGGLLLSSADGASASLRLLNPGETAATVTVETLGPDGAAQLEGAVGSVVEPGTVVDISLAGVPSGSYGLRVTSDEPVTGAVRTVRTGTAGEDDPDTPPVDVAWTPATQPADRGVIPIPTALAERVDVSVTNPGTAAIDVTVTAYDELGRAIDERAVAVGAGATAPLEVPAGALVLVVEGEGVVAGAVVTSEAEDGVLVSAYPMVPDPYTEQSVRVRVDG